MQTNFEALIATFLDHRIGITTEFISEQLAANLKLNLADLYEQEALKEAGIGNESKLTVDKEIRRDKIYWLDKKNQNIHEDAFFSVIDEFVAYLNQTCFAGIKSYEFHYALYEKGAFYKKHLDQFQSDNSRAFSMIIYLNESWKTGDGGELKVYRDTEVQLIDPTNRKCVFFKSNELPHEVLLTTVSRRSITGWLKT